MEVDVNVFTEALLPKFQEYWANYSLRQIFLQQGSPKEIVGWASSGGGYEFVLIYDEQKMIIFLHGSFKENMICPYREKIARDLLIAVKNIDYEIDLNPWGVPLTDRNIWKPINEFLGISSSDFYDQVIKDPLSCFKVMVLD